MPESTPRYALPFPAETDTPDVPKDMKSLAEALDKLINPPGSLRTTAASALETGWLVCDGSAVSRTTYAALFAAIGTAYGEGDKSTTFNLPDYRERFPIGAGGGYARGGKGGEAFHTLSVAEMPAHNHHINAAKAGGTNPTSAVPEPNGEFAGYTMETFFEGSSQAHNNVPPYTVCNVWIKT